MTNWEVKLKGDSSFLHELSKECCFPELCVKLIEGDYFLSSNMFSLLSDKSEISEKADRVIQYINASSKLSSNRHKPIKPDGFWSSDKGVRKYEFGATGQLSISFHNIIIENNPAPKEWYSLWEEDDRIKYVVRLFDSNLLLDWFSLFMIYETIRDDPMYADNPKKAAKIGLEKIKESLLEKNTDFFETANWSRHSDFGKTRGKENVLPEKEITLSEGNDLIRDLIKNWLKWKSSEYVKAIVK